MDRPQCILKNKKRGGLEMLLYCTSIRDGVYAAQICRKVASAENLVRKLIFGHSLEFYMNAAEFVATVSGLKLT